jgi:hypothetical protein
MRLDADSGVAHLDRHDVQAFAHEVGGGCDRDPPAARELGRVPEQV